MKNLTLPTDTELIEFLEAMLARKRWTGKVLARETRNGKGFIISETTEKGAVDTVRQAIVNYMATIVRCARCNSVNTKLKDRVEDLVDPLHAENIYDVNIYGCLDCNHHFTD